MKSVSSRPSRRAPRAGFTLIELLTVIAIIGILAAIIIPVTGRVRDTARQARCASTQRQIALAVILYAGSNRDTLPGPVNRDISAPPPDAVLAPTTVSLRDFIQPYMGDKSDAFWRCLANDAAFTANNNPTQQFVYRLNNGATSTPSRFFGSVGSTAPGSGPKRLSQIKTARAADIAEMPLSRIWMLADIDSRNFADGSPSLGGKGVPPPHNGGRNYAFFDGHVEYIKVQGPVSGGFLANPIGMPDANL